MQPRRSVSKLDLLVIALVVGVLLFTAIVVKFFGPVTPSMAIGLVAAYVGIPFIAGSIAYVSRRQRRDTWSDEPSPRSTRLLANIVAGAWLLAMTLGCVLIVSHRPSLASLGACVAILAGTALGGRASSRWIGTGTLLPYAAASVVAVMMTLLVAVAASNR